MRGLTGRKARDPQDAGGNKLQVADFVVPFLYKIKRGLLLLIFCWGSLVQPELFSNLGLINELFSYGNVFLSYVNETIYLFWNLPFSKSVLPKTNFFFLFSNLGLIITQQTSIHANCFMTLDDTPCALLSQKCILWEKGPRETPSALRCLSYYWLSYLLAPWKKSYDQLRQHIKKQKYYFTDKGPSSQSYGFPVVMYECEIWTIKKAECHRIDGFELCCWRLLRVPWTARRSNQSILKEISPEYSLGGLMLKLKLQHSGHLMRRADPLEKTMILGTIEGKRRGQQGMIRLD